MDHSRSSSATNTPDKSLRDSNKNIKDNTKDNVKDVNVDINGTPIDYTKNDFIITNKPIDKGIIILITLLKKNSILKLCT